MEISKAPVIPNAVMIDRVIADIQRGLIDRLPWLDAAFGRAQRITKMVNGKKVVTPAVYCGGLDGHGENDYLEVSPDSKIGNFAFFLTDDPQSLDWGQGRQAVITAPFSLVVWFDCRKVFADSPDPATNRNTENVKAQILRVLNGRSGWLLRGGRLTIGRTYEQAENIYRGFSLDEVDNQFLMHPFAGFRFEGTLQFDEICEL